MGILYSVGIAGHIIDQTRPLMLMLTPGFLFLTGLAAVYPVLRESNTLFYIWVAAVFIVTFALEAIGTATGLVFGAYNYGTTLGPHILDVPPVIALNWVLVILGIIYSLRYIGVHPALLPLLTGAGAFVFDYVMEPVAIQFGYWTWAGGDIPIQNYIAWTLIAAASALAYNRIKNTHISPFPVILLVNQTGFFLILRLFQIARILDA